MWVRNDDGSWKNPKLRRVGRAGRGLFHDLLSWCGDQRSDGFVAADLLFQLDCAADDADLALLVKHGLLHRKGQTCRCMDKRGWSWPAERGYLVHDWLDFNPSAEENALAKAQKAELRDPELRAAVRARDFGVCRYCLTQTNPGARRGPTVESLDHIDPTLAIGADNLAIACKPCNSAKRKRTPAEALMTLHSVDEARAAHYAQRGEPDPDAARLSAPFSKPFQNGVADAPGRVGYGSGGVGSGRVGLRQTKRDSSSPNPYLRAGHGDPSLEPPPPEPDHRPHPPPSPPQSRTPTAVRSRPKRRRRR